MKPLTKMMTALVLVVSLVTVGCSSSSDSSDAKASKTTTTVAGGKTITTKATDGGGEDDTLPPTSVDSSKAVATVLAELDAVDTSDFCTGLSGMVVVFQKVFSTLGDVSADPAEEEKLTKALNQLLADIGKVVPAELKDDWATFAAAAEKSDADKSADQMEAQKNIGLYVKDNCKLPAQPAG